MGAHVIKVGSRDMSSILMARSIVTHVALKWAGMIHDYELACIGGTAKSVPNYIRTGQFGMWKETAA